MCGICGVHAPGGVGDDDVRSVDRMSAVLVHRGPDGEGRWSDHRIALAHRRLAVIDVPGGRQPAVADDGRVVLVYNGEVYNHRDLRRILIGRGHRFRTGGDTEVVLRGYEEWGDGVVERLRGMFAFAVWDARRDRLLLARDRLGVKPLYHAETPGGRLVFASEIKAVLQDDAVPRALNAPRLPEYLSFRTVSGAETMFEGIRELEPGTIAVREGVRLAITRYWSPSAPAVVRRPGDQVERGRGLIRDAVESRLGSDVPLGALTSGGIDSSLTTTIAAAAGDGPLDTFCVGFEDAWFDERPQAREVAAAAGTRHHEIELSAPALEREVDRLTWANDEPLFASNSVGIHLVADDAKRRGVTVLVSGEGADEVFGGYGWYHLAMRRASLGRFPALRTAAAHAPAIGRLGRLRNLLGPDTLVAANAFTPPSEAWALAGRQGDDPIARRRDMAPGGRGREDDLFVHDQRTYLQGILQRQDRMAMAAAVEMREPLLDHHLVEWANGLPLEVKLAGGVTKSLLRDVACAWLPRSVVDRPKNGFAVPTGAWMMPGRALGDRVAALTDADAPLAGALESREVERRITEHRAGTADHRVALWTLVALDAWARVFLGPRMRAAPLPGAAGVSRR